ncbi:AraC family transcriptional regulator [Aestuariivivens sp. NBU2969]|uniref:helix-turn-helix domain-containing protein n=1 Tax=Aestuariivivens sp. NBU2969 TaxID=2873267 RepID=UPI001CBE89C2|nr:helix-turn-helix domain-containing protein [Aestuariivivens sp. NBU2969]
MDFISIVNFLLIAGVVQGFVFNLVTFFVKKKFDKVIVFLNLIVFFISLNNLQRWLIANGYSSDVFLIKQLLIPWYLFILPMFYAFVVYFLKIEQKVNNYIKTSIAIFGIELIIRLCLISYVYYEVPNHDDTLIYNYTKVEDIFNLLYTIFLFINSIIIIFRRHHLIAYILSYDDLNWLKWFIRFGVIVIGFWAVALSIKVSTGSEYAYKFLNLSSSILLYWIGYQGMYKYNVLKDRIVLRSSIETDKVMIMPQSTLHHSSNEDDFFNDKHDKDFNRIQDHIINNKLYLNPLLGMESLASDLGMSKSYFSRLINTYSDFNFSDYINSLRVAQAKKFLANDEFSEYTIVAIGLECGFNSKSTFYSAFKKFTSQTPTSYRDQF